jgi:hypothetical protein
LRFILRKEILASITSAILVAIFFQIIVFKKLGYLDPFAPIALIISLVYLSVANIFLNKSFSLIMGKL